MSNPAEQLAAALAHHQSGRAGEAERLYRQLLAAQPDHADALHLLGALYLQTGRPADAVELIGRALALRPTNAEFANHLGAAYGALGRHEESITVLRRAVQLAPADATAHYNLGTALHNAKRTAEAAASFRHAIAAKPDSPEAHYNLGNVLRDLKQPADAEASFRAALRLRPNYVKALVNLGNVLRDQKKYDDAFATLAQATTLDPRHASARMNLGIVLRDACRFEEAVGHLRQAVQLKPDMAEIHNNLGTALQALGQFDEAATCYEEALRLNPELEEAHFSRATWRMRAGDLAGGFAEYEWRWKCPGFADRGFAQPRWDGSPLAGRTILLYAEQGLGDTLHFVRYAEQASQRGGRVIVECQKPLLKLLANTPGISQLLALGEPLPPFDVHAPLMSMPGIVGTDEAQLWNGPYLFADKQLVEAWRERLAGLSGKRIGICWRGNAEHMFNAQRSFPLSSFAPLARMPGVRLISLQKEADAAELSEAGFEVTGLGPEFDGAAGPFMDSAAVIENLDLVIACDTAIAHLAGGMGAKVWLALSTHGDWRWMSDRDDTPWYPSMRLFRQTRLDDWSDVFARMAEALQYQA